ncbi:hypothetical protein C1H46_009161 [Malus baccata]|uniref:Uncharacterized protein n=1 Tax=Malus baccata TaxID=106549 RepID=A0A540N2B6_MALBA|nr:hypothetical protein C1H46_009161 [Malus baccata]
MATSLDSLSKKVKSCFLDLGAFPEDKKIPLDVLTNMWVEIHGIDEEEAFAILVEHSNKNLLTLVKDASCYDISVTQHDVPRDLALHLSNDGSVNKRSRLLMPRRETELPREWERDSDQPFQAMIVSVHTALQSLRRVVCDEDISWMWRDAEKALPELHVQGVEKHFDLDWLDE